MSSVEKNQSTTDEGLFPLFGRQIIANLVHLIKTADRKQLLPQVIDLVNAKDFESRLRDMRDMVDFRVVARMNVEDRSIHIKKMGAEEALRLLINWYFRGLLEDPFDASIPLNEQVDLFNKIVQLFQLNKRDQKGETCLFKECMAGDPDMVALLIDKKANVNLPNHSGTTPLMEASASGYVEIVKLLIQNGADRKAKDQRGWTAMDYASMDEYSTKDHKEILKMLHQ